LHKEEKMELGIGMFGDRHGNEKGELEPAHQRLQEMIEEIRLMDETGLDFFGIGEHHRPEYAVSAPEIVLAAAAGVTKTLRLGSAVAVLSSADPVRLYQQYATLDGLSSGRAELVVGRGSFTESFPLFGYELADYDTLFEEKLELLLQINREEKLSWKGAHRAALVDAEIYPRAVNGGLDIWAAVGGTPESVLRAARHGLPIIFAIIGGNPAQFKPLFDYYRKAYAHFGHQAPPRIGVHMHAFFGEDGQQTADSYFPLYAAQMNRIGRQRGWQPYRQQQFEAGRDKSGALLIGDPSAAIDKILYLHELFGITRFAAHMDVGGPSHKDLMKSIELFGTRIAPEVRKVLRGTSA
jgi:probable LLM family oxidoreductase